MNPVAINDAHRKKRCFTQFNTRFIEIETWLLLTFFIFLHNQLSSIHSIVTYYGCLKKVIHKIDSKNERLLL